MRADVARSIVLLDEGDRAPAFDLPALEGPLVSLDVLRQGARAVVLVFLRHLG